jgi:hypothetical protein
MKKRPAKALTKKSKTLRRPIVKFVAISDEMKVWSGMLAAELHRLPGISTKPMFGFLSFYRNGSVFAALPQTRGFGTASSLLLKFNPMPPAWLKLAQQEPRMEANTRIPGKGWASFRMNSDSDLHDALVWLNRAYDKAKK